MAQWHVQHATKSGVSIESRRGTRGAKAYAPFGAGRETGHQKPAVAAKRKGKAIDIEAELRTKPCIERKKEGKKKKRRTKKKKEEKTGSGKEGRRVINERGESVTAPKRFSASGSWHVLGVPYWYRIITGRTEHGRRCAGGGCGVP